MTLGLNQNIGLSKLPARVLLVGEQWDDVKPMLRTLANEEGLEFIGPAQQDFQKVARDSAPSVIMVGPGFDYLELLSALEQHEDEGDYPPVLVCISHDSLESDDLFEDADDFLLIPCTTAEMDRRIKRLVLRSAPVNASCQLVVGKITLDPATYQVTLGGSRVALAWLEFQLLRFLMENVGRIYTREQLLSHVWGVEDFAGTRTVDVHIRRLRHKLEVYGDQYFRTVKNVGYGMLSP